MRESILIFSIPLYALQNLIAKHGSVSLKSMYRGREGTNPSPSGMQLRPDERCTDVPGLEEVTELSAAGKAAWRALG